MYNAYDNQPSTAIKPYQKDIGQNCAAYNPYFKSYSYFDFYCGSYMKINKDTYWTVCLVERQWKLKV